jgi:C1A family cysteine protease
MNPIRDQMQCGSCYSFAAVATTEGRYAVKYGARVYLSEQQIVDCARDCYGCNGGFADRALIFLKMNGAMSQASYPYYN